MAAVRASSAGTTSAALPAGSVSGDVVVVFAYRADDASLSPLAVPTLPADWSTWVSSTVGNTTAVLVAARVYDGVWSMPTFTNATVCHAVSLSGAQLAPGTSFVQSGNATVIDWGALDTERNDATSVVLRGVCHDRPDVIPPTPTSHTLAQASGVRPGYGTFTISTANPAAATSTVTRASAWLAAQVEVRSPLASDEQGARVATTVDAMFATAGGM